MREFTPGQIERMRLQTAFYRGIGAPNDTKQEVPSSKGTSFIREMSPVMMCFLAQALLCLFIIFIAQWHASPMFVILYITSKIPWRTTCLWFNGGFSLGSIFILNIFTTSSIILLKAPKNNLPTLILPIGSMIFGAWHLPRKDERWDDARLFSLLHTSRWWAPAALLIDTVDYPTGATERRWRGRSWGLISLQLRLLPFCRSFCLRPDSFSCLLWLYFLLFFLIIIVLMRWTQKSSSRMMICIQIGIFNA